ncbi:integrin beta-2-like [Maniola jurtina]|uniref:integrin beta-2-like n=1 Tax=Maniola jurtina TaxID=191418 RepID=UPI001E68D478|nr:integrin beta-2-like [Maniola jurtina]
MGINNSISFYLCIAVYITITSAGHRSIFSLDKSWICDIKKTCVDCLCLSQCSWCSSANKCFSEKLPHYKNYCQGDRIRTVNHGMSLEDSAICACDTNHLAVAKNCQHPAETNTECSGRGTCLCGRCFCDEHPDPQSPSKMIMGEYCEYDNFSCNDTKCNEGPYNIYELQSYEENFKYSADKTGTR